MTDGSAGRSPLPLLLLVLGAVGVGYGQLILAPPSPSAAWTGVLDSATAGPGPGRSFPGSDASRTITLHLHGQSTGRTFSVPEVASLVPDQLKSGDTVRALVGWGKFRDLPAALHLTAEGTPLIDSARVLPAQRTGANRLSLIGGAVLALGLVLTLKGRGKG